MMFAIKQSCIICVMCSAGHFAQYVSIAFSKDSGESDSCNIRNIAAPLWRNCGASSAAPFSAIVSAERILSFFVFGTFAEKSLGSVKRLRSIGNPQRFESVDKPSSPIRKPLCESAERIAAIPLKSDSDSPPITTVGVAPGKPLNSRNGFTELFF